MDDIAGLKAAVNFRALVEESHLIDRSGKVHCPYHDDAHPSCHIYPDGFKCFACGVYGDHIDWLEQVRGLGTAAAIASLRERSGRLAFRPLPPGGPCSPGRHREAAPLAGRELRPYRRRLARLRRVPGALAGRSLSVPDLKRLGIAAVGEDALLPILDPQGRIVALKRRFHRADRGRYAYAIPGHGNPAWVSPGCADHPEILVIEGELNGMVAYLALDEARPPVGVVAPAGAGGRIVPALLKGRRVYLYADGDEAGRQACARWRVAAIKAGAAAILQLRPFAEDACELAGRLGRGELARLLGGAMLAAALDRGAEAEEGMEACNEPIRE